jgi:MFS family permease
LQLGGLGLPPPTIGAILSAFGILNGVSQILFFARIHNHFGTKNVFFAGMLSAVPLFVLFPVMNALAIRAGGVLDIWVWLAIGLQIVLSLGASFCYGLSFSLHSCTCAN